MICTKKVILFAFLATGMPTCFIFLCFLVHTPTDLTIFKNKKMYWLLIPNFVRGVATGIVGLLTVIGFSKGLLNKELSPYMNIALQVATIQERRYLEL